jgi:hypothetical protein
MSKFKHLLAVLTICIKYISTAIKTTNSLKQYRDDIEKINEEVMRLSNDSTALIALVGGPGQGKTSTMAALLNLDASLPIGEVGATTGVATYIKHSNDKYAEVIFLDGSIKKIEELGSASLMQYIVNNNTVDKIVYYTPLIFLPENLRNNVTLVDVPGAFSIEDTHHTQIAMEIIEKSHMILLFSDYRRPTFETLALFEEIKKQRKYDDNILQKVYFIFNKIDTILDETSPQKTEEKKAFVEKQAIKSGHLETLKKEIATLLGVKSEFIARKTIYISARLYNQYTLLKRHNIANKKELDAIIDTIEDDFLYNELQSISPVLGYMQRCGIQNSVDTMLKMSGFDRLTKSMVNHIETQDLNKTILEQIVLRTIALQQNVLNTCIEQRNEHIDAIVNEMQEAKERFQKNKMPNSERELVHLKINQYIADVINLINRARNNHNASINNLLNNYGKRFNDLRKNNYKITDNSFAFWHNKFANTLKTEWHAPLQTEYKYLSDKLSNATEEINKEAQWNMSELHTFILGHRYCLYQSNVETSSFYLPKYQLSSVPYFLPEDKYLTISEFWEWYVFNDDYKITINPNVLATVISNISNHSLNNIGSYQNQFEKQLHEIAAYFKKIFENGVSAWEAHNTERANKIEAEIEILRRSKDDYTINVSKFSAELQKVTNEVSEHQKSLQDLHQLHKETITQ